MESDILGEGLLSLALQCFTATVLVTVGYTHKKIKMPELLPLSISSRG